MLQLNVGQHSKTFLLSICRINSDPNIKTDDILPVVLVLIEGGHDELETAVSMLKDNNQVVVIDGSGGAANFLAALYREESNEILEELKEEFFEADPTGSRRFTMQNIVDIVMEKKKEKIDVYSLNNKTTSVDQVIQNALFKIYTDDFDKKKSQKQLKILSIKKQCDLVGKWNRCDLAAKHIFVARNRTELSVLQIGDDQTRIYLHKRMKDILTQIPKERSHRNVKKLEDSDREERSFKYFKKRMSKLDDVKKNYSKYLIESLEGIKKHLDIEFDHVDKIYKERFWETIVHTANTGDKYTRTICHKEMKNILSLMPEESSYKYLKRRISKLNDVKSGYFAYLLESLEGLKMHGIKKQIETESRKDSITELFESSLIGNKTDFVKLIMDRLENFNAFVRQKIQNLYTECNRTDTAIHLVVQNRQEDDATIILKKIRDFLRNLFGDSKFQFYEDGQRMTFYEDKRPYHHCFVWAILLNRKEIATIFWEKDTDYICSALFASGVLKELAKRAYVSNNVELTMSLKENSRYFENEACTLMTELYESYPERGSKLLINKVSRYNSTPLAIAHTQKLTNFMANSACQAKLNDIWMGKIAPHTPVWRVCYLF
ncbi:unnamed protein product [Mytilus edulis]|uniref:Uncharacterized protein n=1 Tax=Mytilus edulis TaxID=6550 RepID=A0A8S3UYK1_MYTED|nr:unnamed protein product [Mytilus edulis]